MKVWRLAAILAMLWLGVSNAEACCGNPDPKSSDDPSPQTAEEWLERAEKKLGEVQNLHAQVVFHRIEGVGLLDTKETRTGSFVFVNDPARFAVDFQQLLIEGRKREISQLYVFDGQWLVDRNGNEKIFRKQQIVPPNAGADQADPLSTGDGPFFIPLSATKGQILEKFDVTLEPTTELSPEWTVHLRLIPKVVKRGEIKQIDLWYDTRTLVPVRAETLDDAKFPNQNIILLEQVELNKPVDDAVLDTGVPEEKGWDVQVKEYQE